MVVSKHFKSTLILNWKDKSMRIIKKKKNNYLPYEIPVEFDIEVEMPEQITVKAEGKITVPGMKAKQISIEQLGGGN